MSTKKFGKSYCEIDKENILQTQRDTEKDQWFYSDSKPARMIVLYCKEKPDIPSKGSEVSNPRQRQRIMLFYVKRNKTIKGLKKEIKKERGVLYDFELYKKETKLEEERTLKYYDVEDNDMFYIRKITPLKIDK